MKIFFKNKLLVLFLILGSIFRLYSLSSLPALNADEAAIGYNAYSLIETGKDEHGNAWPIHFQSFNDYKPGGYFYAALPFVYAFGLNVWSVRIPGVIFGVLGILLIYLLSKELTEKRRLSLISALFLAVSPWHLHFSRGGWEVNMATTLILAGVLFFIKGVKQNKYLALSMIAFAASLYTYHAARVIVPLIGFSLLLVYRKKLFEKENIKLFLGSLLLGSLLVIPLAFDFLGDAGSARASGVSIFADRGYIDRINEKRGRYSDSGSIEAKIIHNKPKEIALEFSRNYFEHFWGEFLFLSGDDIQRNKIPEEGMLFLFQAPLILLAFVSISKQKRKGLLVVLLWLFIAPIPAALTFQSPHALRAQNMVIPLTILSAYGANEILNFLSNNLTRNSIIVSIYIAFALVFSWSVLRYLHQYYVHLAKTYPYSSQYGLKEMSGFVSENLSKYNSIVITTRYDQPYIMYLFYTKYPPKDFQNNHTLTLRDEFGFSTVEKLDKLIFKGINFEKDKEEYRNALILGSDEEIPDEANVVHEVYGENGVLYFQAVAN